MAETGYNWSAWAFAKDDGGTDWDADALADNATEISNTPISLDTKAACEVGIALYEDNTGAIDGVVTIYVLGSGGGIADEEPAIGSPWAFTITPVQNDTVYKRFSVSAADYGDFKIAVKNESGQELAVSVKYRTATVPVAS
jgi:hypothetical protein